MARGCAVTVALALASVVCWRAVGVAATTRPDGRGASSASVTGATTGAAPPGHPTWTPTYDMSESTIIMPCNETGMFDAEFLSQFGVVDFDWSNGKQLWANTKPMNCEELLVEQAKAVKQISPDTKVFVYRNLVKALPWFSSVREKILDPAYAGFFLKFNDYKGPSSNNSYHVPACTYEKCSGFYHDQEQTPEYPRGDGSCAEECDCGEGLPCGEYLWNHANGTMLHDFLVNDFVMGPTGMGSQYVDGFYFDDGWSNSSRPSPPWAPKPGNCDHYPIGGATEENYYCSEDMGLEQSDTTTIMNAYDQTKSDAQAAVQKANGFNWQSFARSFGPTTSKTCIAMLLQACSASSDWQTRAAVLNFAKNADGSWFPLPQFETDLATFLLARGPYAWLGYGWLGCSSGSQPPGAGGHPYTRPPGMDVDYGTPAGLCSETASGSGVFTREWSKASVSLDCNTMTPKIVMKG